VAPAPRKLAAGRNEGRCVPRRVWWLRTKNSSGRRVSISFKTELEARTAAAKLEAARILGQDYQPRAAVKTVPPFAKVAEEAVKLYGQLHTQQPSTTANREWFLRSYLLPRLGDRPMMAEHFNELSIMRLIAELRGVLSDTSLGNGLGALRMILDHAVRLGLLSSNPMRASGKLWKAEPRPELDPFSSSEIRAIVRAAYSFNPDFATSIELEARTGLRPGELMALRRQDVDLRAGTVEVHGSWHHGRRGPTKTRHSERRVSVPPPRARRHR